MYPGELLIKNGLLSNSPETPTWAISLRTLDLYHSQRLYKPNYSAQNFVQALSRRLNIFYHPNLTSKFTEAYDVYLAIHRRVEEKVAAALNRIDSLHVVQNFCPPCTHVTDGEPTLKYKLLYSLDGGSSYKRFKDAGSASRQFNFISPFIIDRSDVDKWKHVIKRKEKKTKKKRTNIRGGEPQ